VIVTPIRPPPTPTEHVPGRRLIVREAERLTAPEILDVLKASQ
jgi:hypothetical protein